MSFNWKDDRLDSCIFMSHSFTIHVISGLYVQRLTCGQMVTGPVMIGTQLAD